jgi:hypothetical protein
LLAELANDVPFAFVAVTVNVYAVPSVKPVTTIGDDAPDAVTPLGLDVTVKLVIEDPPVAPAVKVTDACPADAVAVPIVGACGLVVAVIAELANESEDDPNELSAYAENVYDTPDCNPVTTIGEEDPVFEKAPGFE